MTTVTNLLQYNSTGSPDNNVVSDDETGPNLEAYTVVLSTAVHVLSAIFGGGSCFVVVLSIVTRSNINKLSYVLVLTLLISCCFLSFVWSSLEVTDLLVFHHTHQHPFATYITVKTYIYLVLIILVSFAVVLLSLEGLMRFRNCFGKHLKRIWPVATSLLAVLFSLFITSAFIARCIQSVETPHISYTIVHRETRYLILVFTIFAFCMVSASMLLLLILLAMDTFYCDDSGRLRLRQHKVKLAVPEFLISQSQAGTENDGAFEPSQSGSPSPSSPQLLSVSNAETSSCKGDDISSMSDLSSPANKPVNISVSNNRLGINMAQVLGRRRHTICQITDSTSSSVNHSEPSSKAKQYNYVRKFSVDISALQAQLQNPKICKDAPFQSDIDLTKKSPLPDRSNLQKTMSPSLLLAERFTQNMSKFSYPDSEHTESPSPGATSTLLPPLIMVSNEDTPPDVVESGDGETPLAKSGLDNTFQADIPSEYGNFRNSVQKPSCLILKSTLENNTSVTSLESGVSRPSNAEAEGPRRMIRLTFMVSLTFLLSLLPVLVTEVLENSLPAHAFINISTCTLALSAVQTVVYPHLIVCFDEVVHKSVEKLKKRVSLACSCCSDVGAHSQVDDASSISQV